MVSDYGYDYGDYEIWLYTWDKINDKNSDWHMK